MLWVTTKDESPGFPHLRQPAESQQILPGLLQTRSHAQTRRTAEYRRGLLLIKAGIHPRDVHFCVAVLSSASAEGKP